MFLKHQKNLVSVHRFTLDNNVLKEFYPYFFLVKDLATGRIILRGRCVGGLYPLISSSSSWSNKQAYVVTKAFSAKWHSRLGHPSSVIVRYVLSKNKLSYESSVESVYGQKSPVTHYQKLYFSPRPETHKKLMITVRKTFPVSQTSGKVRQE